MEKRFKLSDLLYTTFPLSIYVTLNSLQPKLPSSTPLTRERLFELFDENFDTSKHVLILYSIARGIDAKNILEIGVREGISTEALLTAAEENNGILYSVDINPCIETRERLKSDNWRFFNMPSDEFFKTNKVVFDCVFIDGDHSYEQVKKDFWNSYNSLRDDGIIMLHDYFSWVGYGVKKLVDEIPFEKVTLPFGNGLTIVRKS